MKKIKTTLTYNSEKLQVIYINILENENFGEYINKLMNEVKKINKDYTIIGDLYLCNNVFYSAVEYSYFSFDLLSELCKRCFGELAKYTNYYNHFCVGLEFEKEKEYSFNFMIIEEKKYIDNYLKFQKGFDDNYLKIKSIKKRVEKLYK